MRAVTARAVTAILGLGFGASLAGAQTGVQDQVSPILFQPEAHWARFYFPGSTPRRQEVRVDVAGRLEGVRLGLIGDTGTESVILRVRWGTAAIPGLVLAETIATKTVPGDEVRFFDLTASNINLIPGDTIVIELERNGPGMGVAGSHVAPPGAPLYARPLYDGDNPSLPGWRIGFETFMLEECRADLTRTAIPGAPGYGVPNGTVNNDDFFYFLSLLAEGDRDADLTHTAVPGTPGYGVRNQIVNNDDFFFYLTIFSAGC